MTEGVNALRRVRPVVVVGDKEYPGGTQRKKRLALSEDSHADSARRVIAATRRDDDVPVRAPFQGEFGAQGAACFRPLDQAWHMRARQPRGF